MDRKDMVIRLFVVRDMLLIKHPERIGTVPYLEALSEEVEEVALALAADTYKRGELGAGMV